MIITLASKSFEGTREAEFSELWVLRMETPLAPASKMGQARSTYGVGMGISPARGLAGRSSNCIIRSSALCMLFSIGGGFALALKRVDLTAGPESCHEECADYIKVHFDLSYSEDEVRLKDESKSKSTDSELLV